MPNYSRVAIGSYAMLVAMCSYVRVAMCADVPLVAMLSYS